MLQLLSEELGVDLAPRRVEIEDGAWVQIDGVSDDPPILVEAWAHQGKAKSAQRNKVATDALKLLTAATAFAVRPRLILLFADEVAAAEFRGSSWRAQALRNHNIEIRVADIPSDLRDSITEAQVIQYR